MFCKLTEAENVEHIFFNFFYEKIHKPVSQKGAEGALSMGESWMEFCARHHLGHAIIFVDCCDCPKFLL